MGLSCSDARSKGGGEVLVSWHMLQHRKGCVIHGSM